MAGKSNLISHFLDLLNISTDHRSGENATDAVVRSACTQVHRPTLKVRLFTCKTKWEMLMLEEEQSLTDVRKDRTAAATFGETGSYGTAKVSSH